MERTREARLFWIGAGGLAPVLVAAALVGLRDEMLSTNVALVLVTVVVLVAVGGGREAGATAAVLAALSFDFFHTRPYLQLPVASGDDVETTVLLLAVGLVVGHVAATGRRARHSAEASTREVRRIHRVAELVARGEGPADVIMAAEAELVALLNLRNCRFEAPPFTSFFERLERGGALWSSRYQLREEGFELPSPGVEVPVLGRGQVVGRFVLEPTPGTGASLEKRVVAVAIADQVGAVLAAPANDHPAPGQWGR